MPQYRFASFVVSPRRRVLIGNGRELPLIPRYFDLLVFLIERRHEAVHRREIFDRVWADVIVSDSALTQAIRTLRRTLEDDPREPRFIRTVSRHGYRFVFVDVVEEEDHGGTPMVSSSTREVEAPAPAVQPDSLDAVSDRLLRAARARRDDEEAREAAELLHSLGTARALHRLEGRDGHAFARALLRDTRWDSPGAGPVPLLGVAGGLEAARELVVLRLRRVGRAIAARWAAGAIGGGAAGTVAGLIGGALLVAAPESRATLPLVFVMAVIGAAAGALGGSGVAAGLSVAEAASRSRRTAALVAGGATGGAAAGVLAQSLGGAVLSTLLGIDVAFGGGIEGLLIGTAAGISYAVSTGPASGGLATPRGVRRLRVVLAMAAACGATTLAVALAGRPLVGETIHRIALVAEGSQATLTPLGALLGEGGFGPLSRVIVAAWEGALFGFGLGMGVTRRPAVRPDLRESADSRTRSSKSHDMLTGA